MILLLQALFCSSLAFCGSARPIHQWCSHRQTQQRSSLSASPSPPELQNRKDTSTNQQREQLLNNKKTIVVESALVVPFSATTAFDAFSDLTRQVDYSPWLHSVTYLNPPRSGDDTRGIDLGETKWTMAYMGVRFSWNSIVSKLERPHLLEWHSASGMKNFGSVQFTSLDKDRTEVVMRMTFVTPRLVAALFRRSSAIAHVVEKKIIRTTLVNFRDAVAAEETRIREEQ